MKSRLKSWLGFVVVCVSVGAMAQVSTGTAPFGSFTSGPDVINLGNLNVHFAVPVINKPGRGLPFSYNLSYDSSVWSPASASGTSSWTPIANWGWRGQTDAAVGYISFSTGTSTCRSDDGTTQPYTVYLFKTYVDEFGTTHIINGRTDTKDQANCISGVGTAQSTATDASGLTFVLTNDPDATVIARDGSTFHPPLAIGAFSGSITDRNGNQITTTNGAAFVDTLGMTALSVSGTSPKAFTYTDSSGTARSVTINYGTYTVQTNFGCAGISEYGPTSASLVSSITLPDGSSYSFQYEVTPGHSPNITGRVRAITLRTGGTISYAYTGGSNGIECVDGSTSGLSRTTMDGTTDYSRSGSGTAWTTTILDASTPRNQTTINFQAAGSPANFYETHRTVNQGTSTTLAQTDTCYNSATQPNCSSTAINVPITEIKAYVILNNGQTSLTDTLLNGIGLISNVDEYDLGASPHGPLVRRTLMTYAALGNNLAGFPASVTVQDGNGVQKRQQLFGYDAAVTATSGVPQHVAITGSRGNLTSQSVWVNTTNSNLTTTFTYDDTGNTLSSTDSRGNTTQFSYADNFSDGVGRGSLAYVTQITQPATGTVAHITSAQYDPYTGATTATTDQNSNSTTYTYDSLLRPLTVNFPDGGQTSYTYNSSTSISQSAKVSSSLSITNTTIFDGLGRLSQKQLTSDPAGTVYTDYTYNGNGWTASVSNSHRSTASSTDGRTLFSYDALGRLTVTTQPDNSTVQSSYSNNCVTATDEVGNKRQTCKDALGRMTSAWEDPSGANYETDYTYDALNDLLTVNQKGGSTDSAQWRTRTYTYDSLSRMTQSTMPEQGTSTFNYLTSAGAACSGNPFAACQRTDARSITTTYSYDGLNRLTSKSYSDGTTPTVSFLYDTPAGWTNPTPTQTNLIGRMSEAYTAQCGGATAFGYDSMGRVVTNNQQAPSSCTSNYAVSATYNLAGGLSSLLYPSGRVVNYGYNGAGSLNSVQFAQWNGTTPVGGVYTYWSAADANFYPGGAANTWTLGNGVVESVVGNNRLQPSQFTTSNPTLSTFANRTLSYQPLGQMNPSNNGNVYGVADQLNSSRSQSFTYDPLNRLATANEGRWGLAFVYDPWGNFLQQNLTAGTAGTRTSVADAHNKLTSNTYDLAGNTLNDGFHTYVYDAEGRVSSVDSGTGTSIYGGNGFRARETVSGVSKDYIYFGGQTLATRVTNGAWQDYIQGPGGQIARAQDFDNGLRIYGNRCSSCGSQFADYYLSNAGGLNNYVIRTGDKLYFTQYQLAGSHGGALLVFSDGTNSNWSVKDKEGYFLNDDQSQATTHVRTVDLSSLAGKRLTQFALNDESDTAGGSFAIIYEQMVLVSTDGTVQPIYTGQTSSPVASISGTSGITATGTHIDVNTGHAIYPQPTTIYFGKDHLVSSRTLTGGYGYPIWQATFLPYGQEYAPQMEVDNFKFTSLEHDDETGLDHATFRQFSGTQGRWSTPDPYSGSMTAVNPQSLNRYNYVGNNPLNGIDPLGLVCSGNIGDFSDTVCNPANFGGGGGSGGDGLGGGYFDLMNIPVYGWDFGPFYLNQTVDSWTFPGGDATARIIGGYAFGWFQIGTGLDLEGFEGPSDGSPSKKSAKEIAQCAAKVGNSLSLAALLPKDSNQFLQNALSNDFSTISDLVTGPAGATRLDAATSVLQGKLTSTAVGAVGSIPIGPDVYKLGVNGAGTEFVKDVVTTPLAEKALGQVAGALLGTVVDVKLAWDAVTYAYGLVKCQ